MARRPRLQSDPSLATAHETGATVYICSTVTHKQFGVIVHALPRLWMVHYDLAQDGASELYNLHRRVLGQEPDPNGMRALMDESLLRDVYDAGNRLVSNAVRCTQHLAEEIERYHRVDQPSGRVEERIRSAMKLFSEADYRSDDYAGLTEFNGIRDAIEHPKPISRAEQAIAPLSWMLSEGSLEAWQRFSRWFQLLSSDWERFRPTLDQPGTIEVQRGMRSTYPVKKPPKQLS